MKNLFDLIRRIKREPLTQHEVDMINGVLEGDKPAPAPKSSASFPVGAIDAGLLKLVAPNHTLAQLERWVEPIRKACLDSDINTIRRVAAFITTLAHEGGFKVGVRENMNYSASRLIAVWPSRFRSNPAKAKRLHRNPEAIANEVYANRMGNGPPSTGDGWRYRGNGPIQLTGKSNHAAFAKAIGKSVEDAAEYVTTLDGGVASASWFWRANGINRLADTPGIEDETKRINGGTIGIADRRDKFDKLVRELLRREKA